MSKASTAYKPTKAAGGATNSLKSKFEQMAVSNEEDNRRRVEEERNRRKAKEETDRKKAQQQYEEEQKAEQEKLQMEQEELNRQEEANRLQEDQQMAEQQRLDEERRLEEERMAEERRVEEQRLQEEEQQRLYEQQQLEAQQEQERINQENEERERLAAEAQENYQPESTYDEIPNRSYQQQEQASDVYDTPKPVEENAVDDNTYEAINYEQNNGQDQGMCAKALYDYQATDDDEITFDPDDVITMIEQVDEGWWMGTTSSGKRGLFPANYVELIQ